MTLFLTNWTTNLTSGTEVSSSKRILVLNFPVLVSRHPFCKLAKLNLSCIFAESTHVLSCLYVLVYIAFQLRISIPFGIPFADLTSVWTRDGGMPNRIVLPHTALTITHSPMLASLSNGRVLVFDLRKTNIIKICILPTRFLLGPFLFVLVMITLFNRMPPCFLDPLQLAKKKSGKVYQTGLLSCY